MNELITIMITSIAFAYASKKTYIGFNKYGKQRDSEPLFAFLIFLLLAIFMGLRTKMNDTGAYRHAYEFMLSYPQILEEIDWSPGSNPGFVLLNSILKANDVSTQSFLMLYSLITNGLYIWFVRKYNCDFPLSIFLLFTTGAYDFTGAAIKQCVATALALYAVKAMLEKKWLLYVAIILLAATFHSYVIVFFVLPFLNFTPGSRKTYVFLVLIALVAFLLKPMMDMLLGATALLGDEYTAESFMGDGVNIFRVLVCNAPTMLILLYGKTIMQESNPQEDAILKMMMMNGAIMIVGLFGTANYFARLANFFIMGQVVGLPIVLKRIGGKDARMLKIFVVVGYLLYFIYESVYLYPFSLKFSRMGLWEYLTQSM